MTGFSAQPPALRELGSGIADGTMTWHTVATHSTHAEFVEQSRRRRARHRPRPLSSVAE
jgi:hypothetical protein